MARVFRMSVFHFSSKSILFQHETGNYVRTLVQLITFAPWLRLWLMTRSQLVSLRALLLASAPLAGICSGSSLLMAHLAAPLSRRALLLCFFQVSGLADGVRPFAFSHVFSCSFFPVALFRSLFSDSPSCCAEKNEKTSPRETKKTYLTQKLQLEEWSFRSEDVF